MARAVTTPPAVDTDALPRVSVRALCAFGARTGDLDHRFAPGPSAREGMAGHATVSARRSPGHEREVVLAGVCAGLQVHGRADGFDPATNRIEEVKTHRGDIAHLGEHARGLHWAQARAYGALLCASRGLDAVDVALVYFNIDTGEETVLARRHAAAELQAWLQALCERYARWARACADHRRARNAALAQLAFPFDGWRHGQRELTEAVFRTQRGGRHLLAQAPTGIGKTAATLFAALRAMPAAGSDQLLYLTARTTGRALALEGLRRLRGTPLRVLERVARESACEHPDKACHGESCPLAHGFHDRLDGAREDAARAGWLDRAALRDIALRHGICPYHLGQEMQRWVDVVVGDVNHWFDLNAGAWALAVGDELRVQLLVDEAHNLIERARRMHSASLDPQAMAALRTRAPAALRPAFDRLHRAWGVASKPLDGAHTVLPGLPTAFVDALQRHLVAVGDFMAQHPALAPALQAWYFDALHWQRVAEGFGDHAMADLTPSRQPRRAVLHLRCIVPAPLLAPRWAAAHAATLFSATLTPMAHVQRMLGLPEPVARIDVPSPFDPAQLRVHVATQLSTRWADRARSLPPLIEVMAAHYREQPGNYLAFFSSFDYLQQAHDAFVARHPDVPVWAQSRAMDEPAREAFIARFAPDGCGIGFAVLGGAFGEGIDLPGSRLCGAFIATLGLPPVNPVNEHMRERLDAAGERGWEDTYLYPGLQKVVQAAGRVIRTPQDRGVVVLLDDRFARPEVRALLPAWWRWDGEAGLSRPRPRPHRAPAPDKA